MKARKWTAEEKLEIVLEGLREKKPVAEICREHQMSQTLYYRWRDKFLEGGKRALVNGALNEDAYKAPSHPFWGYRRVTAWLRHREGLRVNGKRVRRVMREHGLGVFQRVHRAKRASQRSKPRAERPHQYWGIDMTKFLIPSLGWVYLVIVLDWYTKKVVGWNLSWRSKASDWKEALEMALLKEFPSGVRGAGLKLVSDNGSQPTSTSFMKEMEVLGIEQIFSAYDNPVDYNVILTEF